MGLTKHFLNNEFIQVLLTEVSSGKEKAIKKRIDRNYKSFIDDSEHEEFFGWDGHNTYGEMLDEILRVFESIDPTPNGTYYNWLADIIFKDENYKRQAEKGFNELFLLLREDNEKIHKILKTFEDSKADIKREGHPIDINKYESISKLYSLTQQFADKKPESPEDEKELLTNEYFIKNGHAEVVFDNSEKMAIHTKTLDANKFYGCTSNWCTNYPKNFKQYDSYGVLIVIIDKSELNSNQDSRRSQLFLSYSVDESERFEWRDLVDDTFINELSTVTHYLSENELKKLYSYLSKISKFEMYEGDNLGSSFYAIPSGFSIDEEGFINYDGEIIELMNFCDWGDSSKDFVESILTGEQFLDYSYPISIKDTYKYEDISKENLNKISQILILLNKEGAIDLSEYSGEFDGSQDDIIGIIEELDIEELKSPLEMAYLSAKESADINEYYESFVNHIEETLQIHKLEYTSNGVHAETDIMVKSDNKYVDAIFGTKDVVEILEEITAESPKYYSPREIYGDIDNSFLNEVLADKLIEEF